jgi:sarcosine oxidase
VPRAGFEIVVVGAGVLGLSAAHALARRGHQVVVLEQQTVGHGTAGSKGTARIFRLGYDEPGYVRLALLAHSLWRRLEDESGSALLTTTGQLTFGDDLDVLVDAMAAAGAPHERLATGEVKARFPTFSVPGPVLFEPESGVIAADECLAALRRTNGVTVREQTRVAACATHGGRLRLSLETPAGTDEMAASVVVVCAGPWTAPLVPGRPPGLRPLATLEQAAYLAPAGPVPARLPVFVERRRPWFYGLPVPSGGLLKVALHGGGPAVSLGELDRRGGGGGDATEDGPDPTLMAQLSASTRRLLPGLDPHPVATERCVYDNSADGNFVIDRVGDVVVGSGTSGHGFKFAPLLGELLADLATGADHRPELGSADDLAPFSLARLRTTVTARGIHR